MSNPKTHSIWGHPRGLFTLFQTELWERFSYYGMRAILLLFLADSIINQGMGLDMQSAKAIVATYSASAFMLSILGGWAADRLWGPLRATLYGGFIIISGHIVLSIPISETAYLGIILIAIGTGMLKPNIATMVGSLYEDNDKRRDAGFSIFYMGINIGALLAPLVVSYFRNVGGYHAGFIVAAIGMAIALYFYLKGKGGFSKESDKVPNPITAAERTKLLKRIGLLLIVLILFWGTFRYGFNNTLVASITNTLNLLSLIVPIGYFIMMFRSTQVTKAERSRLLALIPIFMTTAAYSMLFEQGGSSLIEFAVHGTQLDLGFMQISPEWYNSVNPLAIILLTGAFAYLWVKLNGKPSIPMKLAIGLGLVVIAFYYLGFTAQSYAEKNMLAPWWVLFVAYIIMTIGELCSSPVGYSAATLLSPKAFKSQGLALWLMASAFGQAVAGIVFANVKLSMANNFIFFASVGAIFTIILLALSPWTNRKIKEGLD
ncbi:peptide MFS transporter [Avibacterium avium]|uniref:peptide MFS transporter n=1 Tax=Avibacterium avium TaxID=751 RepID=UPI003BF83EB8